MIGQLLIMVACTIVTCTPSRLHAVLGINWDSLADRATHNDYYLTNQFVPEVLSPVLVRVASVMQEVIEANWWQSAGLIVLFGITMMGILSLVLGCLYRRHLARQIKKFPLLAGSLEERNHIQTAAHVLSPK